MSVSDDAPPTQSLGAHGEPCPACGAPLASDQRYCLNCGRRRAGSRVPYADLLAGRAPEEVLAPAASPPPPPAPPPRRTVPVGTALAGAGGVALVLAVGVLIGAATSSNEEEPRQVAAAPVQQEPPVINVNAAAPAAEGEATEEPFVSDWPGDDGWTVQLEALPKDDTEVSDVDQAKSDAEAQGAEEVGALDSDEWPSLDPAQYIVYSGVFTGNGAKAKAQAAAKKLKKDFPEAKAVEVSAGDFPGAKGTRPEEKVQEVDESALEDLEQATGEEQQKKSAELPETLGLEGEPPPTDNQEPGAGSETQVIE
jgi:hypothetical protein